MLPDQVQSFRAVTGQQDLIVVLEHIPEYLPVDLFIVRHEDQPFPVGGVELFMAFQHSRPPFRGKYEENR